MKIECISISSSSDGDHNLSDSEVNDYIESDGNHYAALCETIWVPCEFCDEVFNNRFSQIKHNATHIIIPLIKQTHQCTKCQQHFTSIDELTSHICVTLIKTEKTQSKEDLLQSIIEKEVIVKCEDDFKHMFTINKVESLKTEYFPEEDEAVRKRLMFEDEEDEEDTILSNDLNTVQLDQPINTFRDPIKSFHNPINSFHDPIKSFHNPIRSFHNPINSFQDPVSSFQQQDSGILKLLLNGHQNVEESSQGSSISQNLEVIYTKPVHYDNLIVDEVSACRFCGKRFPNRFELLKHEPSHMKLRRFRYTVCGFCEQYIAGNYHNLRKHIDQKHPGKNYNKFNLHKCQKCQLMYFNYYKHNNFYHLLYKCRICLKRYEKAQELNEHKCEGYNYNYKSYNHNDKSHNHNDRLHNDNDKRHNENGIEPKSAMMKLCEMCYSFMKNYIQKRVNYEEMGELSEIGVQQMCDKCNNKFFVVKLVKRESVFKQERCMKESFKPKKVLSNADRLKRVQNRLKMIQLRNKF